MLSLIEERAVVLAILETLNFHLHGNSVDSKCDFWSQNAVILFTIFYPRKLLLSSHAWASGDNLVG